MVNNEVWKSDTLEKLNFIKGQRDIVERLKRADVEITQARDSILKEMEYGNDSQ